MLKIQIKRKQYFIHSPIQKRYLIHSTCMMIVPALIVSFCLYFLIFYLISDELMIPETVIQTMKPVILKLNVILGFGLPLLFCILFFSAIIISHRLAGPLYRLEKDLEKIAHGEYSLRIKFRKQDHLDELAHKMNAVLDHLPKEK